MKRELGGTSKSHHLPRRRDLNIVCYFVAERRGGIWWEREKQRVAAHRRRKNSKEPWFTFRVLKGDENLAAGSSDNDLTADDVTGFLDVPHRAVNRCGNDGRLTEAQKAYGEREREKRCIHGSGTRVWLTPQLTCKRAK